MSKTKKNETVKTEQNQTSKEEVVAIRVKTGLKAGRAVDPSC